MIKHQKGAALLLAMLTAAVIAAVAAAAVGRFTHLFSVETSQRHRMQMTWLLQGALDWARLILREDAKANGRQSADHLNEPWAMPLQEARLSTFLAAEQDMSADRVATDAFLSGAITDAQSMFNLTNLRRGSDWSEADVLTFENLCERLKVDASVWLRAIEMQAASQPPSTEFSWRVDRLEDWFWWGVPMQSIQALAPYVTILPQRTPLNINTAPAILLEATWLGLRPAQAQRIVAERALKPFTSTQELQAYAPELVLESQRISTTSQFFWVKGRLRLDDSSVTETSLLKRDQLKVSVLRRERQAATSP